MKGISFTNPQEAYDFVKSNESSGYILFSNINMVLELSKIMPSNVLICSTSGEYTSKGYIDGAISGIQYDLKDAEVVEILYPPIKSIKKLKAAYSNVKNNRNSFALLLCDGLTGMEETIVSTFFFVDDNFKIIGGSAGDGLKFKETYVFLGTKRIHSAVVFFNSTKRTHIVRENIYVPTDKRLLITEADIIKRTVKTFNRIPASTEYAKTLGIAEAELPNHFMNNPLGKIYRDEIFIASPMKVNADKSITFYCQLMANTIVEVLRPIEPIEQLRSTLHSIPFKPSFVFAINCILRSLKFQNEGIWKSFDRELLAFCPNSTGFISYGEQFYGVHANQTMVMLAIE